MPNILLITDDQHRADALGAAGHPVVETPHLDQLAYEGIRFDSAYTDCPICIPSRCSLISGQYASTYGQPYFFSHQAFPIDRSQSMMSLLTQAGYQTQAVGKMHFYPERACYGFENMILDFDYSEWLRERGFRGGSFTGRGLGLNEFGPILSPVSADATNTAWTVDESIRFLHRRDPDRPFFLWVSFNKPHPPLDPPEPYYSMYATADIPPPAIGDWVDDPPLPQRQHRESNKYDLITSEGVRRIRAAYYGLITEIDHQLGRLFGVMKLMDVWDDTLVVFSTDHGEFLGDHRDFGKQLLYDVSARVPLIVRWPRDFAPQTVGTVVHDVVALVDLMPTFVEFVGAHVPDGLDGRSLLRFANGSAGEWRSFVPLQHDQYGGLFGLTDGDEKYLWYRWGGREQFFDLRQDPYETHDIAATEPENPSIGKWRQRLTEWLSAHQSYAVQRGVLTIDARPYPDERYVRSLNPLAWTYDRPFS